MLMYRAGLASLAVWMALSPGLMAGERNLSASVAPVCARGECRPAPHAGARVQGALLQAAALSVVGGPRGAQTAGGRVKDLPRRSQARLPSWYRRAQAAQLQGQSPTVAAGRNATAPPRQARVRESSGGAAVGTGGRVRTPSLPSMRDASTAAVEPKPSRSAIRPRSEARGARHRRLIEESMEQLTLDEPVRRPRQVDRGYSSGLFASAMDDSLSAALPQPTPSFSEPEPVEASTAVPVSGGFSDLLSSSERTVASSQGLSMSTSGGTAALPAFSSPSLGTSPSAAAVPEPTRTISFSPTGSMSESAGPLTSSSLSEALSSSSNVPSPPAPTPLNSSNWRSDLKSEGIYSIQLEQDGDVILFPSSLGKINLTLTDSNIKTNGSIVFFAKQLLGDMKEINIRSSNFTAGKNLTFFYDGMGDFEDETSVAMKINIEGSLLNSTNGHTYFSRAHKSPWGKEPHFSKAGDVFLYVIDSALEAKNDVVLFSGGMRMEGSAKLDLGITNNSAMKANKNLILFDEEVVFGEKSELHIDVNNSTLEANENLDFFSHEKFEGRVQSSVLKKNSRAQVYLNIRNSSTLKANENLVIFYGHVHIMGFPESRMDINITDSTLRADEGRVDLFSGFVELGENVGPCIRRFLFSCFEYEQFEGSSKFPVLQIQNSTLSGGRGLSLFYGPVSAETGSDAEKETLRLNIKENSRLSAASGDVVLIGDEAPKLVDLELSNSHMSAVNGSTALVGGVVSGSHLGIEVRDNSSLIAQNGNASLIQQLGSNNALNVSMNDSVIGSFMSRSDADQRQRLVAGIVGQTSGSNNRIDLEHSNGNTIEARMEGARNLDSLVIASLAGGTWIRGLVITR